jgi:acyl-CoA hydrolase
MRRVDPDQVGALLASVTNKQPRIVASGNHAAPWRLLEVADKSLAQFALFMLNAPKGIPDRDGVTLETPFVGAGMRRSEHLAYYPCRLSLVPALLKRRLTPDVVMLHVAPPRQGVVSLGVEVNVLPAAVEATRAAGGLVVAQVNRHMPYTTGDALLAVDDIDLAIDVDEPLGEMAKPRVTDEQHVIGQQVASLVPEGATLQLGIGAIPDATLDALSTHRGLRIWSEMISDGVMALEHAGALGDDPLTTSFAFGSAEFYQWVGDNPRITFCRTERANDPAVIARQPAMTSINAAMQVDLFAQANASYVDGRIYSGFGGQTDFIVGAIHSLAGHAIIALQSWHAKTETSTIVEHLQSPATSFQHSYVVTEHGAASIWGRPQREQAVELIEHAAAPQVRDELRERARWLF